jgi:hypothetical protein
MSLSTTIPAELRFSGQIYTVTVDSIANFARRLDPGARTEVLRL